MTQTPPSSHQKKEPREYTEEEQKNHPANAPLKVLCEGRDKLVEDYMKLHSIEPLKYSRPPTGNVPVCVENVCKNCIDSVASALCGFDFKNNLEDGDDKNKVTSLCISSAEERQKAARFFLSSMNLQIFDHVSSESFSRSLLNRKENFVHKIPLRVARVIDHRKGENTKLFQSLVGDHSYASCFATGSVVNHKVSPGDEYSDHSPLTFSELMRSGIDVSSIREECNCLKRDDEWVQRNDTETRHFLRLIESTRDDNEDWGENACHSSSDDEDSGENNSNRYSDESDGNSDDDDDDDDISSSSDSEESGDNVSGGGGGGGFGGGGADNITSSSSSSSSRQHQRLPAHDKQQLQRPSS